MEAKFPLLMRASFLCRIHNKEWHRVNVALDKARDILPNQSILENFVHRNPLKSFEDTHSFESALTLAHDQEVVMSLSERIYVQTFFDPRKRVREAIVELSSVFLDRGAAKWTLPRRQREGFLMLFADLENLGFAPWRAHARVVAKDVAFSLTDDSTTCDIESLAASIICENLRYFGIPEEEWDVNICAMLLEVRGWAGMFHRMESCAIEAPKGATVRLIEFAAVHSIFSRASMGSCTGWNIRKTLKSSASKIRPQSLEPAHPSAISFLNQDLERRKLLEHDFERTLIHAIGEQPIQPKPSVSGPKMQVFMCIDDRSCSFRRHLESAGAGDVQTFGVAGFFGIPIQYRPIDGRDQMILAPDGSIPSKVLVEKEQKEDSAVFRRHKWRGRLLARGVWLWEKASFSPLGSFVLMLFAPFSFARLWMMGFSPKTLNQVSIRLKSTFLKAYRTDFEIPFSASESAALLARTLNDVGTAHQFAPLVLILGHGSVSVNNPYFAAYNCGACSGHEGGPNARLLARLANDLSVREALAQEHNIHIPSNTVFVGGMHNTTSDAVEIFDAANLPEWAQSVLDEARGSNALERCQRFFLADRVETPAAALDHVMERAFDAAEVRPELNHSTNAAVVVGRRQLTAGHFLDRRVFLPSYDPFADDESGTNLEHVMGPALLVCSGINLEYLFSTVDSEHHGAGSKAPLNVVGNIAVLQGTSGDLRPGLPSQMTEMHDPVRALFVIDSPVSRVEAVLERRSDLAKLVRNEWVRFVVRDPMTGFFHRYSQGQNYERIQIDDTCTADYVSSLDQRMHGRKVAKRETLIYRTALGAMTAACVVPITLWGTSSMLTYGWAVALGGTLLAAPTLAFSRRYLHGEYLFGRVAFLSTTLVLGFNVVALAPSIEYSLVGWSIFGFASTFLIGAYNNRPSVRNNATFAFAAYRISDFALLAAAALLAKHGCTTPWVAGCLILAATFKSSQIPLTSLFVRSMEGPTSASALGYAGLSAHLGIVLLASTEHLWTPVSWAPALVALIGASTAVYGTLVSKTRADRKGSIASATSATLGLLYVLLASGHANLALVASFGHASFRMIQILRSPNFIADSVYLRSWLGSGALAKEVPSFLFKMSWALRRLDSDFHLLNVLHWISKPFLRVREKLRLNRFQRWTIASVAIVLAGAPLTPFSHALDEWIVSLIEQNYGWAAFGIMAAHFGVSVLLIRFLLLNVLSARRFKK